MTYNIPNQRTERLKVKAFDSGLSLQRNASIQTPARKGFNRASHIESHLRNRRPGERQAIVGLYFHR